MYPIIISSQEFLKVKAPFSHLTLKGKKEINLKSWEMEDSDTNVYFLKMCTLYTMEKRQPLQQKVLGKLVSSLQKTETRSMDITLYQY
jgi:hypothetical protein